MRGVSEGKGSNDQGKCIYISNFSFIVFDDSKFKISRGFWIYEMEVLLREVFKNEIEIDEVFMETVKDKMFNYSQLKD